MKHKRHAILLAATMLACSGTMAQQPLQDTLPPRSTTPQYDEVIESRGNLHFDSRVPASGIEKSYWDNPGTCDARNDNDALATSGARNLGKSKADFASSTSSWFLEGKVIYPGQIGLGLQAAYVPKHWGGYASLMQSGGYRTFSDERGALYDSYITNTWLTGGAIFRPFLNLHLIDLQLFGGLAVGDGGGTELGIRLGSLENRSFSWFSSTFSVINTNHGTYFTIGLSIGVTALACFPVIIL